jgi:hypothetical protein
VPRRELARRGEVALRQRHDPASPLMGSTNSAATRSSIAASSASTSSRGTRRPGTIGRNGSCMYGLPVRASVPIVRPWNAFFSARMRGAGASAPRRAGGRA